MDSLFISDDTLNKSISIEEVRKVISNLKNGKSPGIDLIYNEVLRKQQYLEENEILSDAENGFRRDRSCEDHIFTFTNLTQNRKSTFVTFVDLHKAFDLVNRDLLQYKLQLNGINGPIYDAISSLYEETFSCVCINDLRTNWLFLCSNGVRQEDNLSPTLFSLFINDLASEISQLNVGIPIGDEKNCLLLYANDIAILSENEVEMQRCLDILTDWCMR